MRVIRIADPDQFRRSHVLFTGLVIGVLLGTYLLTNGPLARDLPEGRRDWRADSPLRAVVGLLNLNYAATTETGVDIKALVLGGGTAAALLFLGIALVLRPGRGENGDFIEPQRDSGDSAIEHYCPTCGAKLVALEPGQAATCPRCAPTPGVRRRWRNRPTGGDAHSLPECGAELSETPRVESEQHPIVSPLLGAQFMFLLYVLWSFASTRWAAARGLALDGSILLAIQVCWALAIGSGLHRRSATVAAWSLPVIALAAAILAVWYYYERTTGALRASYPIGNPIFLAACLIPGLLLGIAAAPCVVARLLRRTEAEGPRRWPAVALVLATLAALSVMGWAFFLAQSRGPLLALIAGGAALVFFSVRHTGKWLVAAAGTAAVLAAGIYFLAGARSYSATGRDATIRVRVLALRYAGQFIASRPLTGLGQAGFASSADAWAARDALGDWPAVDAPINQAHNEWVEVLTDLGAIGLGLVGMGLVFTFVAGARALARSSAPPRRWMLIALLASLAAIVAEEMFSPSLRLPGLPAVFYTIIGLIWAMSATPDTAWMESVRKSAARRWSVFVLAVVLSIGAAFFAIGDFAAARAAASVSENLATGRWEQADSLAVEAVLQLLPLRQLAARQKLAETRWQIAAFNANAFGQAMQAARGSSPPDPRLLGVAARHRKVSEEYIERGLEAVDEVLRAATLYWGSGAVSSALYQLKAQFAQFDGQPEAAEHFRTIAADKLRPELQRRPYDFDLSLAYAALQVGRVSRDQTVVVIARPLRYAQLDGRLHKFLSQLAPIEGFSAAFGGIVERSSAAARGETPASGESRPASSDVVQFAPEILRIAAGEAYSAGQYESARALAELASTLYSRLSPPAPLAAAACRAELAELTFLASPDDPRPALALAEQAMRLAPASEDGRRVVTQARSQIVDYLLASDNEATARQRLAELMPNADRAARDRDISDRFTAMCSKLMKQFPSREVGYPPRYIAWIGRAVELNPASALARCYQADITLQQGDEDKSVQCLRQALSAGADPEFVATFCQFALTRRPESQPIKDLLDELIKLISPQAGAASQPTPPHLIPESQSQPASVGPPAD